MYIVTYFQTENIFEALELSMMNISKQDLHLHMLLEFKLGNNVSGTSVNINRAWGDGDGSTSDWTLGRWLLKFCSWDESLEDEEGRGQMCILNN